MDSIVLWQHKWSADLFIPTYLFLGGLTAGVVFVACLADLLSAKFPRLESLSRSAAIAAVPLLGLAGVFLTIHLGKPERGLGFPLFFTNYESWMTRGGWIFGTDSAIVLVYAALWYFRVFPEARRLLAILGLPAQVLLSLYTGMLLSGAGFVPLWSKEFLPLLFLSSALTTGTAAAGLILIVAKRLSGDGSEDSRATLRWLSVAVTVLLLVELYEIRAFTNHLAAGAPDKAITETVPTGNFDAPAGSRLAYQYLTGGESYPWKLFRGGAAAITQDFRGGLTLAPWFWFGFIGIGFALPLLLTFLEFLPGRLLDPVTRKITVVKLALVLVGGYLLRVVIVWGGDLKAPLPFPPSMWPVPGIGGLPIPGLGG
jgi:formate-dependent nitrite reductase membrane component NrfD